MTSQDQISSRVRRVVDALEHVHQLRNDWLEEPESLGFHIVKDNETGDVGVLIPQSDDPADALVLNDNGLKGLAEGSMYLPWNDYQGEAFFAAVITTFLCHGEILQPPVCEQCEAEKEPANCSI